MIDIQSVKPFVLGIIGAIIGGFVGYQLFVWILGQGLYAIILPPSLLGLGAGLGSRQRIQFLAVLCGLAGLALGLFVEWRTFPFVADDSGLYFVTHVHQLKPISWIMIALGAWFSYRLALGVSSPTRG